MVRKENLEFLVSVCPPTLKEQPYGALLEWLFGTTERSIEVCLRVAYGSMKRKIRGFNKMPKQNERAHYEEIERLILRRIDSLLKQEISQQAIFDSWHKSTCEQIIAISDKHNLPLANGFKFGLAQYWLNLTVKNMLLMEKWDEFLKPIRKYLHIPVDGFIVESATDKLDIKVIDKPWRRWDYCQYIRFQENERRERWSCLD